MSGGEADFGGPARQDGVGVWVRWMASAQDGQVHAFPIDDSQRGRWPQAVCSYVARPGALGLAAVSPRCPWCVLGVSAPGTGRRHRRIDPPGTGARMLARFRRHRAGSLPTASAERPDFVEFAEHPGATR